MQSIHPWWWPSRAESTWEINNYGKYINQFLRNIIKSIRQYERINKKIFRQKISIMFNEICIIYIYIYTHTHTHIYIYIYIYIYHYVQRNLYYTYIYIYIYRHQQYGHRPPITKTIQARRTRHAGHCWRSKDLLISDVLLWTLAYGPAKAGRPPRTYIQQLCEDTGWRPTGGDEWLGEAAREGQRYPC